MWAGIADNIATHYGPVIESRWERDFVHLSGVFLLDSYGYWGFPGFKADVGSINHPSPRNAEVEFSTHNLHLVPA